MLIAVALYVHGVPLWSFSGQMKDYLFNCVVSICFENPIINQTDMLSNFLLTDDLSIHH